MENTGSGLKTPLLSVIIPTHLRPESLRRVLNALSEQSFPADAYEVLVVVDGPSPETESLLTKFRSPYKLQWFVQPRRGACAARNMAVQHARGALLLCLDDDVIPTKDLLTLHYQRHQDQRGVVLGGVLLSLDAPDRLVGEAVDWTPAHFKRCSARGYQLTVNDISNANLSFRKEDLLRAGGWDEGYAGYGGDDDRDLALRLRELGLSFRFEPRAFGHHFLIKNWERWLADARELGRTHLRFLDKHPDRIREMSLYAFARRDFPRQVIFGVAPWLPEPFFRSLSWFVRRLGNHLNPPVGRSIVKLLIKLTGGLAYSRGFWEDPTKARSVRRQLWMKVPILCYHRVVPRDIKKSAWTLDLDQFERGIRKLAAEGYQTVSLGYLRDWQTRLTPLPAKPVVLTFDDGQKGFIDHAAPILQKYGFHATIFLIAGKMGQEAGLKGPSFPIMGAEEARALAAMGFAIEGHSFIHGDWTRMSLAEVRAEVSRCAKAIQEATGRAPQFFAYPYGKWTQAVRDLLESMGFAGACTTEPGSNDFDQDPFLLKRHLVLPWNFSGAWMWALNRLRSGGRGDRPGSEQCGTPSP